ncbi:MAG: hypothetical protein IPP52_08750 [Ignavibacteria bacterium]|nr:hypothetical protein [Ignavibacteria bacterium]
MRQTAIIILKEYLERFQNEIKDVIDVIHGKAVINERRGHASGIYSRDISQYTIAILLGREWEPVTVTTTNKKNSSLVNYNGSFISSGGKSYGGLACRNDGLHSSL